MHKNLKTSQVMTAVWLLASCAAVNLSSAADLNIQVSASPDPVVTREHVTYTIVVDNEGPGTATNVLASLDLPDEVSFESCTLSQGIYIHLGPFFTCIAGNLPQGGTLVVTVDAVAMVMGSATGKVSAASDTDDEVGSNNRAEVVTQIVEPNQSPVLTVPAEPFVTPVGATVQFTVGLDDLDHDPATVAMTQAPAGASFESMVFSWTPRVANQSSTNRILFVADDHRGMPNSIVTAAVEIAVLRGYQAFVSLAGSHTPPFDTWVTAATNIQAALDVVGDGSEVTVEAGTYQLTAPLQITNNIALRSVRGAAETIIDGGGSNRCVYVNHPTALVDGFTLTHGNSPTGAGVYCVGGRIQNCVISGNESSGYAPKGGGAYLVDGSVSHCTFLNNCGMYGAGLYAARSLVEDSSFVCNTSKNSDAFGLGVYSESSTVRRCEARNNYGASLYVYGGGLYNDGGLVDACLVATNRAGAAPLGAGIYNRRGTVRNTVVINHHWRSAWGPSCMGSGIYSQNGVIENCTVADNYGEHIYAAGLYCKGTTLVRNVISYNNFNGGSPCNWLDVDGQAVFTYSCSTPIMPGAGNITNAPSFWNASEANYRLAPETSPCLDAGTNQAWMIGASDLDGHDRILDGRVDMGAYEYLSGALNCDFSASRRDGAVPLKVVFSAVVAGTHQESLYAQWDFDHDGLTDQNGLGLMTVTNIYSSLGSFTVSLTVSNNVDEQVSCVKTAYIETSHSDYYVSSTGTHVYPFGSWATAATNMEAAIAAAGYGAEIWVAPGEYLLSTQVVVSKGVNLCGVNGWSQTVVRAAVSNRCFVVDNPDCALDGFTITGGETEMGGGLLLEAGTVQNCLIYSNALQNAPVGGGVKRGAGVYMSGGTLRNCVIRHNYMKYPLSPYGSGVAVYSEGGRIENCTIAWNILQSTDIADTRAVSGSGEIVNTIIYENTGPGRGLSASGFDVMYSCIDAPVAGEGNLEIVPRFANHTDDVRLQPSSLCINAGVNLAWMAAAKDWRGRERLHEARVDIGAVEYDGSDEIPDVSAIYVSPAGANIYPYTNWVMALTNLNTAVSIADVGSTLLVDSGTYVLSATLTLGEGVILRGVNGAASTIIDANRTGRCVTVTHPESVLDGFTLTGGYSDEGAGVRCENGTVQNCIIQNNTGSAQYLHGAGVYCSNGRVFNCIIRANAASSFDGKGGGVYALDSVIRNCLITRNTGSGYWLVGLGLYSEGSLIQNCTIAGNTNNTAVIKDGFGLYSPGGTRVENSIIYGNTVVAGADNWVAYGTNEFSYCCALPLPEGEGNLSADPKFSNPTLGDYHLYPGQSPCIDVGTNQTWMELATDLDGESRILNGRADMGVYERPRAPLSCQFSTVSPNGLAPYPVVFTASVLGTNQVSLYFNWDFNHDGITDLSGLNLFVVTNTYGVGQYSVALSVSNAAGETASYVVPTFVNVSEPYVYVSPSGSSVPPYSSWATAATNIQDAVNVAQNGATVWVTNGDYQLSYAVTVNNAITLRSMNGWAQTTVRGNAAVTNRCMTINHSGAVVDGFTLTEGLEARNGGGVFTRGLIQNCLIVSNRVLSGPGYLEAGKGGGAYLAGGTLRNCVIRDNVTSVNLADGTGNQAAYTYGAIYMETGLVESCTIVRNQRVNPSGLFMTIYVGAVEGNGVVRNCIIHNNPIGNYTAHAYSSAPIPISFTYCVSEGSQNGEGNLVGNPDFFDEASGDFRLKVESPCINAGTNQSWMANATDMVNVSRILGSRVDIGAYEGNVSVPGLGITAPNGGNNMTSMVAQIMLNGVVSGPTPLILSWSNSASCLSGSIALPFGVTNGLRSWQTGLLTLSTGVQDIVVSALYPLVPTTLTDCITVKYMPTGTVGSLPNYPLGLVIVTNLQVDRQSSPSIVSNNRPHFSWQLYDPLNGTCPVSVAKFTLGGSFTNRTGPVVAGDVTADGRPDVVVGAPDGYNRVFVNNGGTPDTWTSVSLNFGGSPNDLVLADVTGDGQQDIVAALGDSASGVETCRQVAVLINNGGSPDTWSRAMIGMTNGSSQAARSLDVGDVTGDGRPDIVVGNNEFMKTANYILVNNGGAHSTWGMTSFGQNMCWMNYEIRAVDVTGDGRKDIIAAANNGLSYTSINNGGDPTTWTYQYSPWDQGRISGNNFDVGLINNDSLMDVLLVGSAAYINKGTLPVEFTEYAMGQGRVNTAIKVVDLNHDNLPDILYGTVGQTLLRLNNGGTPNTWPEYELGLRTPDQYAYGLAVADFDGDGWQDVVMCNGGDAPWQPTQVLMNRRGAPTYSQAGYQIQVADSVADLLNGIIFWQTPPAVTSTNTGNGITSILQGTTCDRAGEWYWRVRVFTTSGYKSEWSAPACYVIPTNQVFLRIENPTQACTYVATDSMTVSGWTTWNVTNLVWSNAAKGTSGSISVPDYHRQWSQSIPLGPRSNQITITAYSPYGSSNCTVVAYRIPALTILKPNLGAATKVYTNVVYLAGTVDDQEGLSSIIWSNTANGMNGTAVIEAGGSSSNVLWHVVLDGKLANGLQTLQVTAIYSMNDNIRPVDSINLTLDAGLGLPGNKALYPTNDVRATDLRVNGQTGVAKVDTLQPYFSWTFGDVLNESLSSLGMTAYSISPGSAAQYDFAMGDLNGDGHPDLAAATGWNGGKPYVQMNPGTGSYSWPKLPLPVPYRDMHQVDILDVTSDGRPDIVYTDYWWGSYVLVNIGGSPDTWPVVPVGNSWGSWWAQLVGDLTGDGRPEVVLGAENSQGRQNYVLLNNGRTPATWGNSTLGSYLNDCTRNLALGDVNNDGRTDVVVGNIANGGAYQHYLLLNDGRSPGYWPRYRLGNADVVGAGAVTVADVTQDGLPDVVAQVVETGLWCNVVWVNNGGTPDTWSKLRPGIGMNNNSAGKAFFVDMTGDGRPDLVLNEGSCRVLVNNGGSPDTWNTITPSVPCSSMAEICDVNLDGRPDVVINGHYFLINTPTGHPFSQNGYRIQVARSTNDFQTGNLFWDSGVVASSCVGDGQSTIRQGIACTNGGMYYWRVKLFSSSGYQSEWSAPACYEIPPQHVYLQIEQPNPWTNVYTKVSNNVVSGKAYWNVANVTWSNQYSKHTGTIPVAANGTWTQSVGLVVGTNLVDFVARNAAGSVLTQSLTYVYSLPVMNIALPGNGETATLYRAEAVLSGSVEAPLTPTRLWWSNQTTRIKGSKLLANVSITNGAAAWQTSPIYLVPGAQQVTVWMEFEDGSFSAKDTITLNCQSVIPPGLVNYTTGVVYSTHHRINGQFAPVAISGPRPAFSWSFGDSLNTNTPVDLVRSDLGPAVEDYTFGMAIGDVTGDGRADVVLANEGEQNVVLVNNGGDAANWARVPLGPAETNETTCVAIGDLTGDGRPDIVAGNYRQPNCVYVNNGCSPDLWNAVRLGPATNDATSCLALGDVNNDGRLDVVVGNWENSTVALINNGGSPDTWTSTLVDELTGNTRSVALADVDQDGLKDVLIATEATGNFVVFNNGGSWSEFSYLGNDGIDVWSYSLDVGDLNKDGRPDVVVGGYNGSRIILNTGVQVINPIGKSVTHWPTTTFGVGTWVRSVVLADINGDGWLDVVAGGTEWYEGRQNFALLNNGGDPSTWPMVNLGSALLDYTQCLAVGDLNGDGRPDIAVGNSKATSGKQNTVLMNNALAMPYAQAGYQIQIARSVADFTNNVLFWDSGVQSDARTGDGASSICPAIDSVLGGSYYWRVKVFSSSGQQSPWSTPCRYDRLTNSVYLSISQPTPPLAYAAAASYAVKGWVSANASGVYWTNTTLQAGGFLSGTGYWTQNVSLAVGSNTLQFTARRVDGQGGVTQRLVMVRLTSTPTLAITTPTSGESYTTFAVRVSLAGNFPNGVDGLGSQVYWSNLTSGAMGVVDRSGATWPGSGSLWVDLLPQVENVIRVSCETRYGFSIEDTISILASDMTLPIISILSPNGGTNTTVYADGALPGQIKPIVLSGWATDNSGVQAVYWSNSFGGASGACSLKYYGDRTNLTWVTPSIQMQPGTNIFSVWAVDLAGHVSVFDTLTINYLASLPADGVYVSGPVAVHDLQTDRQGKVAVLSDINPKFSWSFGDALNTNSNPNGLVRLLPGGAYADRTTAAAIGDLTGDGRPDIMVGNSYGPFYVLENNGGSVTGWMRRVIESPGASRNNALAIGDVTGDGLPDVVLGNSGDYSGLFPYKPNGVLVNNGSTPDSWPYVSIGRVISGEHAYAVAIRDLTGDGRPDIIIGNAGGCQNYVLVNNGGSPDTWSIVNLGSVLADNTTSLAVEDLNDDGRPDVVVGNTDKYGGQNYVLLNNGGSPDTWTRYTLGSAFLDLTTSLAMGDVNADGRPDVVVGNSSSRDGVQSYVVLNNGGNPDTWTRVALGGRRLECTTSVALTDLNGDGYPDVLLGNRGALGAQNSVVINNGCSPDTWQAYKLGDDMIDYTTCVVAGDLNADGRPDVFVGNYGPSPIGPPPGGQNYVLMNNDQVMPYAPIKYQVQVARTASALASGPLFWDSGLVSSSELGDGISRIRQITACNGAGDYFWRVRAQSSSRYISEWSSSARYTIPSNQVFLTMKGLAALTYASDDSTYEIEGWASWNTTNITWTNESMSGSSPQSRSLNDRSIRALMAGGDIDDSGAWTQEVTLIRGLNNIRIVATAEDGLSITQRVTIAYRVPQLSLVAPSNGQVTVYQNSLGVWGTVSAPESLDRIVWSNTVSGLTGVGHLEWMQGETNGQWRASLTNLVDRVQTFELFAVDTNGTYSLPLELSVDYLSNPGTVTLMDMPQTAVYITGLKLNRQDSGARVSTPFPRFSWVYGDALNHGNAQSLIRDNLGSLLGDWTKAIALGDLNADGRPDVVVGNDSEPDYVLFNNGGIPSSWSRSQLGASSNSITYSMEIGDLNSDDRPEVVVGRFNEPNVVVMNNGQASETWPEITLGSSLSDATYAVALAELTGDGLLDVVVGNDQESSYVLINNGQSPDSWDRVVLGDGVSRSVRCVKVTDVDGDGLSDVVMGCLDAQSYVVMNNGSRPDAWTRVDLPVPAGIDTFGLAVGDLNADGRPDLVLGNTHNDMVAGGQQNYILLNQGGAPVTWTCVSLGATYNDRTRAVAVADLNGDGRSDVLVGNDANQLNLAYLNNGDLPNTWTRGTLGSSYGDSTTAMAVGDLTGDSRPDVVIGNKGEQNLVLINHDQVMPYTQSGCQIQIAFGTNSFSDDSIVWDSGTVSLSAIGDGTHSVQPSMPCSQYGEYYWRAMLFSSSGARSGWSAPMRFEFDGLPVMNCINGGEVEYEQSPYTVQGTNNAFVTGTMSWTNSTTGEAGTLPADALWNLEDCALAVGSNQFTMAATNHFGVQETVEFTIVRVVEDIDGDGIPNWWQTQYFGGRTNGAAGEDVDFDEFSNWQEFIAGTDPMEHLSAFAVNDMVASGTRQIPVQTQPGRRYTIYFADDNLRGGWQPFANAAWGVWTETNTTSDVHVFEDTEDAETTGGAPVNRIRYYRIVVEKP
jgi:uncharacterized repeat protein (TIGR01451 family)